MNRILSILSIVMATCTMAESNNNLETNFTNYLNVAPDKVISRYKDSSVVFLKNDSLFAASVDKNGELFNIRYAEELKRIKAEGQIAYDKSGKIYYTKGGKMFVSEERENGKWNEGKMININGDRVTRDKYRGSVLAYANWRYMPDDSIYVANPALNQNGDTLYFVSNMGNSNKSDIWFIKKGDNNDWDYAEKMNKYVNSSADEDFPFVRDDGKLTFASNRKKSTAVPDSATYDLYICNPNKNEKAVLLSNFISESLRDYEIASETILKEPTIIDSLPSIDNDSTFMASAKTSNDSSTNVSNDKNIERGRALAETNQKDENTSTPTEETENNSNNQKSENDKIRELLSNTPVDSGNDNSTVSISSLEESFQMNPDSVVKASKNVVATTDKRIYYFDYDKDVLSKDSDNDINVLLDFIKFYPKNNFLIIGHTDDRGTYEYNDALSLKRAKKIRSLLIKKGVSPNRLYVMGLGKYKLFIKDAKTESDHHKNRRVEIQKMD